MIVAMILIGGGLGFSVYYFTEQNVDIEEKDTEVQNVNSPYRISGNGLEDFDISFLKMENNNKNMIYSPLSIKYALAMLSEGSKGISKAQIDAVIGDYQGRKYMNSSNMSFANALFIRDSFKCNINKDYINTLKDKFNAEVLYDSFATARNLNSWVEKKTLGLIPNMLDDVENNLFVLVNALAIDMDWKYVIQPDGDHEFYDEDHVFGGDFYVSYPHETYDLWIGAIKNDHYPSLAFNDKKIDAKAVQFAAIINNCDIVGELGEGNIRKTVGDAYKAFAQSGECDDPYEASEEEVTEYLNDYIKSIGSNYKDVGSSTDFKFYNDDKVKVFAKELKEYAGITLEYIGIMPKKLTLEEFIKSTNTQEINMMISNLKEIESENFSKGKLTEITGHIPLFAFDYELNLIDDLKELGIVNVFDSSKANLSKITTDEDVFIDTVVHKANIEFSNEGIKAAAVTSSGDAGNDACMFDYFYDIPIEKIDLTFDNPYLFLIRDKDSGEVWFVGNVYEPTVNNNSESNEW